MKKLIFILLAAIAFAGCAFDSVLSRAVLRPVLATNDVPAVAVTNTVYRTNLVTIPAVTNTVNFTNYVTPEYVKAVVQPVETVTVLPAHSVVVTNAFVPAPSVDAYAQGVGAAVNVVAPGVGSVVSLGLAGLASVFAAYQNRKLGNHKAANEALGKGIEAARVALQSSGPRGVAIAQTITDVVQGHAEAAGEAVAVIIDDIAKSVGGDTSAAVALHAAANVLNRKATAEQLVEAATNGVIPDWFSSAERNAVAKIKS
jgi:hypothetical protein